MIDEQKKIHLAELALDGGLGKCCKLATAECYSRIAKCFCGCETILLVCEKHLSRYGAWLDYDWTQK